MSSRQPGAGGPTNFLSPQILFFVWLKTLCKIWNPTISPSGRKVTGAERGRKKEKNAVNVGHLVPWQHTQAAQAKMLNLKKVLGLSFLILLKGGK